MGVAERCASNDSLEAVAPFTPSPALFRLAIAKLLALASAQPLEGERRMWPLQRHGPPGHARRRGTARSGVEGVEPTVLNIERRLRHGGYLPCATAPFRRGGDLGQAGPHPPTRRAPSGPLPLPQAGEGFIARSLG